MTLSTIFNINFFPKILKERRPFLTLEALLYLHNKQESITVGCVPTAL